MAKKKISKKRKNNFIQRMVLRYRKNKKKAGKGKKRSNASTFLYRLIMAYVVVTLIVVFIGRNNIILTLKGYSKEDRQTIAEMDKADRKDYVKNDGVINFSKWDEYDNNKHYYDYELYAKAAKFQDEEHVIEFVDEYYGQKEELDKLGYDREFIRSSYDFICKKDFKYLVKNQIPFEKAQPYLEIKGAQIQDLDKYLDSGKDPQKAVLSITYDFIDSTYPATKEYLINSPGKIDTLIKNGFLLPSYYEPKDLVTVNVYRDVEYTNVQLRKEAAQALEEMAADAEQEGLYLGIRSGYRSYKDQKEIYTEYVGLYGYDFAITMVATPGSSEHQLGYGVDITSLSVLQGEYETFGETEEYQWVIKNGHKYGYILRYPENKIDITGTMNEPWHFRYVGKEIAKECVRNNLSLEEYVQKHGFSSTLVQVD